MDELLTAMVTTKQISAQDAELLRREQASNGTAPIESEQDVLKWLAREYQLSYTDLEDIEPERDLLTLFPARILLKHELLPIQRQGDSIKVATSRLFAPEGLDALRTLTGMKLDAVLAPGEAIRREMKKTSRRGSGYTRFPSGVLVAPGAG